MKKTKRELLVLAAATTVALSMGVTVQAKGDEKVLNFGCQMYTDGCVNSANDENGGWNAMRYGIAEALFKFDDNMEVIPWLAESYEVNDEHTEWTIKLKDGIKFSDGCDLTPTKVEEKMYMKVTSVYGLTETAPGMTASRIDDPFDVRCNTVGHDFEFTEVKVIDPETGEECPVGVQGEMCNRGYNTMKGYYKNPEATAEVLDENNFLHSGDLGIKDEDGNYRITGRIKDMIIRGGENIYPREIEEFLYKLDGVKDVQVAGIPSKKYGEAVGAFIILQEGVQMQEADVRDFCRNKISRYKIPKYIFFVNEFPMTGSGKIQKFRLKDLGLQLCKEQGIEII